MLIRTCRHTRRRAPIFRRTTFQTPDPQNRHTSAEELMNRDSACCARLFEMTLMIDPVFGLRCTALRIWRLECCAANIGARLRVWRQVTDQHTDAAL